MARKGTCRCRYTCLMRSLQFLQHPPLPLPLALLFPHQGHGWVLPLFFISSVVPFAGSENASQSAKVMTTVRASSLCQMRQQQMQAVTRPPLILRPLRLTLSCLMTPLVNTMMLMKTCMSRGGISTPEVTACFTSFVTARWLTTTLHQYTLQDAQDRRICRDKICSGRS